VVYILLNIYYSCLRQFSDTFCIFSLPITANAYAHLTAKYRSKCFHSDYIGLSSLSHFSRFQNGEDFCVVPHLRNIAEGQHNINVIRRTFLEDIWGGARRGLLRSSSLSQEGCVVQLALRGT
jgi:hypothetical protein